MKQDSILKYEVEEVCPTYVFCRKKDKDNIFCPENWEQCRHYSKQETRRVHFELDGADELRFVEGKKFIIDSKGGLVREVEE